MTLKRSREAHHGLTGGGYQRVTMQTIALTPNGPQAFAARHNELVNSGRVLIVDDDLAVLRSLRRALTLDGYEVTVAADGESALSAVQDCNPDVVVLDVMLPDVDGLSVCAQLREASELPIIMVTAKDTVPDRIAGLDRGADDYLVKPFAEGELSARLRALLRRRQRTPNEVLVYADVLLDMAARQAYRANQPLRLSPREYDLMELFLRHPRRALSRDQICQQVWGYAFEGESNFVDVAVKELRKKLEFGDAQRIIQTVRGFGYALDLAAR